MSYILSSIKIEWITKHKCFSQWLVTLEPNEKVSWHFSITFCSIFSHFFNVASGWMPFSQWVWKFPKSTIPVNISTECHVIVLNAVASNTEPFANLTGSFSLSNSTRTYSTGQQSTKEEQSRTRFLHIFKGIFVLRD